MPRIELHSEKAGETNSGNRYPKSLFFFLFTYLLLIAAPLSADGLEKLTFRAKIYDIETRGEEVFAVGFPGLIFYSKDQGKSFEALKAGTTDALFSIDLASDGGGAIVSRNGVVLTTNDGGKTWTIRQTGTKEHLFGVAVAPGGKIWAVGHFGVVMHSADGGKTFEQQKYDATLPPLPAGEVENPEDAAKYAAEAENEGSTEEARLLSVTFVNSQKGWITGEFGLVLYTEDGGTTWKRQRSNVGKLMFDIHASDDKNIIAVGSEGSLIETSDGGLHWKDQSLGFSEHLLAVTTIEKKCVAVGRDGVVVIRDKPGAAFVRVPMRVFGWVNAVGFRDAKVGFIGGGRGYLAKTTDGGATWVPLVAK
jgi:photosystem II stability/assembly factor-like uncharacterized protein